MPSQEPGGVVVHYDPVVLAEYYYSYLTETEKVRFLHITPCGRTLGTSTLASGTGALRG